MPGGYSLDYEPYPTVNPSGAPGNDFLRIDARPGAFGARKAEAASELGEGAEKFGENKLDMDSQTYAAESHSWLSNQANSAQSDYTGLKGKAALDGLPGYHKSLDDSYQQAVDQAPNPATKLMIQTEGRRLVDNFKEIGTRHADTQRDQYYTTTAQGAQASAADRALTYSQNARWDDMDHALWTVAQEVQNQYDPPTRGPLDEREQASVDEQKKHAQGNALYNIVDTFAKQGNFKAADAVFDKYKDSDRIDAASRLRITSALEAHKVQRDGVALSNEKINEARGGRFAPSTNNAIGAVASRYGISPTDLTRAVQIESGGNPNARTGSYKGLLQLSQSEFEKYKPSPTASIWNPTDNLAAGAAKMRAESDQFEKNFGRPASGFDTYMIHQQGLAGYSTHLANPEAPAWQNMLSTGEGRQKGERWARAAIWGNIPDQYKRSFGSVDNVTSRDFVNMWAAKYGGGQPEFGQALQTMPVAYVPGPAPSAAPGMPETFGGAPTSFQVQPAFNESRGGFESASFQQPNVAAAIKPSVYQSILDDPRSENDAVRDAAIAATKRRLDAEEIAENQNTKVRKDLNDQAAGKYTTAIGDFQNASTPDWTGLHDTINHDPNLDFKTKHELLDWVKAASGQKQDDNFGAGFWDIFKQIHAPDGDPGKITDIDQLYGMVGPGKPLTFNGFNKAREEIAGSKTPYGVAESQMKKDFLEKNARPQIAFSDPELKMYDAKGEARYLSFLAQFTHDFEAGKKSGLTASQMLSPDSKESLWGLINRFKPEAGESLADRMKDQPAPQEGFFKRHWDYVVTPKEGIDFAPKFDESSVKTRAELKAAHAAGKVSYEDAERIGIERGWYKRPTPLPQVPNTP